MPGSKIQLLPEELQGDCSYHPLPHPVWFVMESGGPSECSFANGVPTACPAPPLNCTTTSLVIDPFSALGFALSLLFLSMAPAKRGCSCSAPQLLSQLQSQANITGDTGSLLEPYVSLSPWGPPNLRESWGLVRE